MTKTIQYKDASIDVDDDGNLFFQGDLLKQYTLVGGKYKYVCAYDSDLRKSTLISVSRAVAMAFVPCPGPFENYQVDHIDDNSLRNVPSNLRWITRKQNNSKNHATLMKSKHASHANHDGQVILAVNKHTGERRTFDNGYRCAESIGCSHVLVYNVLNEKLPHIKSAKDWTLKWVNETV